MAIVDYFGEEKKAHNEIDDLKEGDYIYAQGGYVIKRIPKREALDILSLWKETFFDLQEVDLRLSRLDLNKDGLDSKFLRILDRAMEDRHPSREECRYLLERNDPKVLDYFFKTANFLRQKHLKNSCCVHGILEISNHCKIPCAYCGLSPVNKTLKRYRMSKEEIIEAALRAIDDYGFKALVLQSGEDPDCRIDELCEAIREIKRRSPALIFISFGEVGIDNLKEFFDAGARGLLMRFETSNVKLYESLHPGQKLQSRLEHIRKAYEMGYIIITGGLIGLPGQTTEDIVNDLTLTKELHAEMYSFGPFLPHPRTPLGDYESVDSSVMLKVIACARLIDPKEARVLITTAFETLHPEARREGLLSGGSSVMLNVTPLSLKKDYDIYPDRAYHKETIQKQIDETIALLGSLGRAPTDLGSSIQS